MWPFDAPIYPERLLLFECEKESFSTTYQFESSAEHNYRYTVHNYTLLPVYHFTPVVWGSLETDNGLELDVLSSPALGVA